MARFILIDTSIRDVGGHFYEYARHVLAAARRAGSTTILVTHRTFRSAGGRRPVEDAGMVFPLYRHQHHLRVDEWFFLPLAIWLVGRIRSMRIRWSIWRQSRRWSVVGLLRRQRLPSKPSAVFGAGPGLDHPLLARAWERYQAWMGWWHRRSFAHDTARLLKRLGLSDGDQVFLPTISPDELLGLGDCLRLVPTARCATWHLVFRYSPYAGREPEHADQAESVRRRQAVFRRFQEAAAGCRVFFYTDTERLKEQFELATGIRFRLLPIPHTTAPEPCSLVPDKALEVIYIGDARGEKGYAYLHRIVRDLWERYVVAGRVHFRFQSNYNIPGGEASAVAGRAHLESLPAAHVELLCEPLESAEYRRLLLEGHINLLPYDSRIYYARSSGILIESLTAGVPTVVCDGGWLGDQLAEPAEVHRRRMREGAEVLASFDLPVESLGSGCSTVAIPAGSQAVFATVTFPVTEAGRYLKLRMRLMTEDGRTIRLAHELRKVSAGSASLLVPLEVNTTQVQVRLSAAFDDRPVPVEAIALEAIRHGDYPRGIPRSTVGIAVGDVADFSAAVAEIIEHYEHYRRSAERFGEQVFRWHNADRLVEVLTEAHRAQGGDGPACCQPLAALSP